MTSTLCPWAGFIEQSFFRFQAKLPQASKNCACCSGTADRALYVTRLYFKGGPEPLEKESPEFLGSKRDDRFSNPFF